MIRNQSASLLLFFVLFCSLLLSSCTKIITRTIIQPNVGNLQQQSDLNLVCEGASAYLLLLDSMLISSPQSPDLLMSTLQSYSGYLEAYSECHPEEKERLFSLSDKSRQYGLQLLGQFLPVQETVESAKLERKLAKLKKSDLPYVFWGTYGWLNWVRNQNGSPLSIVELVSIEKIMARLLELDETYQGGSIHLFYGGYHAAKPAMLGGRPDLSKKHFEKAIELSGNTFLLAQTTYAETYARATFNKELHDRLLKEVVEFPLEKAPEFALSNAIAKNRAARLFAENYFAE